MKLKKDNRLKAFFIVITFYTGFILSGCIGQTGKNEEHPILRTAVIADQPDSSANVNIVSEKFNFPWLNDPLCGQWSIEFYDLDNDSVVFNRNQNTALVPASIQKIMTTAAALKLLSPSYTLNTEVWCNGDIDPLTGVLNGNLILIGGHDPSLGANYLQDSSANELIRAVKGIKDKYGLKSITGRILCPQEKDDFLAYPAGWDFDDLSTYYAPMITPLSFGGNCVNLMISQGQIRIFPDYPLSVKCDTLSRAGTVIRRVGLSDSLIVTSDFESRIVEDIPVSHPSKLFSDILAMVLRENGISIDHQDLRPLSNRHLYTIYGQKVSEIIKRCNNNSDNFYAEQLFSALIKKYAADSLVKNNYARYPEERSLIAGKMYKSLWGLDNLAVMDGCGLSRRNYLSAGQFIRVLTDIERSSLFDTYLSSLAVPGREGTLRKRFLNDIFADKLFAKTGSMSGVNNLAGYLITASGKRVAFAILNNYYFYPKSEMNRKMEELLTIISLRY